MILMYLINFFLGIVDWILGILTMPFEIATMYQDYIAAIANVWGYLDSFISLSVVMGLVAAIVVFDNFEYIANFWVGVYKKLPFT